MSPGRNPTWHDVHVSHLTLHDFRSYASAEVALEPGATAFIGRNGQGKTNLVEAIDYLSRLSSHRVASDAPLGRAGADQAVGRAAVVRDGPADDDPCPAPRGVVDHDLTAVRAGRCLNARDRRLRFCGKPPPVGL